MKAPSSKITILGLLTTVLGSTLIISPALALNTPGSATGTGAGTGASTESAFCKNITTATAKITTSLSDAAKKRIDAEAARNQKIADNRTKWDQELATNRAKWDAQRQENFAKLEAKATTDAQKVAVTTYEKAITDAIATRRTANDAARSAYRKGVDDAIAARRTTVSAQVATFQSAVASAIAAAESTCASDPKSTTAKDTLKTSLKDAHTAFQADRANDEKVSTTVADLAKTRDGAIKANDAAFATATAAARDALKAAFKGTTI